MTFHKPMSSKDIWWHPYTQEKFHSMKSLLFLQHDKSGGGKLAHLKKVVKAFMKFSK